MTIVDKDFSTFKKAPLEGAHGKTPIEILDSYNDWSRHALNDQWLTIFGTMLGVGCGLYLNKYSRKPLYAG